MSNLFRAASAVRSELTHRVLRPYDLTWTGFEVLWTVWMSDGMETRYVAESAAISKATLTGVAKTLESRGLIVREGDASDRRLVRLRATDRGSALMRQVLPEFNAVESEILGRLSAQRVGMLTDLLGDVVQAIEAR